MNQASFLLQALFALQGIYKSPLDVNLKTGTFRGVAEHDIEKWLGIPYALPPTGPLRFKAPVPITSTSNSTFDASAFGKACPQPQMGGIPPISEDCLFLNVFRPQGTTQNDSLPVLFWIHPGAFILGAASYFDPTRIIQRSVTIGKPIIFVSINYRLNTFGFLASSHMLPQDLNAGLLDQRQALVFVKQNIAAFGGDPSKVTIWGESAGGGSVQAHFIFPPSPYEELFRAGIADSSTGPFETSPDASTYDKEGKPFFRLLTETNCTSATSDPVGCLQKVPFETLLEKSNTMIFSTLNVQLWEPAMGPDGSMITERASTRIINGDFLHLPFLGGTNINEGTVCDRALHGRNLSGAAEDAAFDDFVGHVVIDNSTLTPDIYAKIRELFPENDPTLGAPFNTNDSLFNRGEAWFTDMVFLAPRRLFFYHGAPQQPMFAYYFTEFIPGNNLPLGVTHGSELTLLFGPVSEMETDFANTITDCYINFVHDLNPVDPHINPEVDWPAYTQTSPKVLQFQQGHVTPIPDDWDLDKTDYFNSEEVLAAFQK